MKGGVAGLPLLRPHLHDQCVFRDRRPEAPPKIGQQGGGRCSERSGNTFRRSVFRTFRVPCKLSAAVGHAQRGPRRCSPCPPSDVAPGCAAAPDEHTAQAYQARLLLGLRGVTERAPLTPLRARRKEATPRCSGLCDHRTQGCGWPRPSSSTSSSGRNATRSHARSAQL